MNRIVAGINLEVQCSDGCTYEGVTLAVENNRRIYLTANGEELQSVQCVNRFVSVLPPMALASVLSRCKECD
jgi:hypothetical protein